MCGGVSIRNNTAGCHQRAQTLYAAHHHYTEYIICTSIFKYNIHFRNVLESSSYLFFNSFDHFFHRLSNQSWWGHRGGPRVLCWHSPLTEVLWVGPGPVLLLWHWPVAAWVAGATDVLHLTFLLHGLTDACNVTRKLWIGANCVWIGRIDTTLSFWNPQLFSFTPWSSIHLARLSTIAEKSQWL